MEPIKKIPPQALKIEDAVIGGLLVDDSAPDKILGFLRPEHFYKSANQKIFAAAMDLFTQNKPIDVLTVTEQLKKTKSLKDCGGEYQLLMLANGVGSAAHIEHHGRLLLQQWIRRQIIKLGNQMALRSYDPQIDVFELLAIASKDIDLINDAVETGTTIKSFSDAVKSIPSRVEFLTNNKGELTGYPWGIGSMDKFTQGMQPGHFIVIGADSGMGKTSMVLCSMAAGASIGKPCGMFSMEMPIDQLATKIISLESHLHMRQLTHDGFDKKEYFDSLNKVVHRIKDYPIFIDDRPALTVPEMKTKARALKRKNNIEVLFIDFLQMFGGDQDMRLNIGAAARACKNLAKELNIPVVALSQLSRAVRESKYCLPQKNHLKEASAIEEAADMIVMPYRPSYYGFTRQDNTLLFDELYLKDGENTAAFIRKNRFGPLGTIGMFFDENRTKFMDAKQVNAAVPF